MVRERRNCAGDCPGLNGERRAGSRPAEEA